MKFQPGDLVTYKDQFTQRGAFDGAPVMMVLKTKVQRRNAPVEGHLGKQLIFVHRFLSGLQGWDWSYGYVKMPFKPDYSS